MLKHYFALVLIIIFSVSCTHPFAITESPFPLAKTSSPANTNQEDEIRPLSKTEETWNQPIKPFKIIGNVYYVGASDVTSYLITTPQGHILLDSGFAQTVPLIKANIATLGFKLEDVKILLNGHAHYDHCGGLAALKEATGARFMVMDGDADLLERGGKGDFYFENRMAFKPIKADRRLRNNDKVELGGVTLTAIHTPGHTKGCTTWTMKATEGNQAYDVVFAGSSSVPGYNLLDSPNYPTMVPDYERTFSILKKLPCDIFLGQHGGFFELIQKAELLSKGSKNNPFIDPQGYKKYVNQSEKNFYAELKKQQQARKK
jgi:metallo-beta-lactamase class B